MIYAKDEPPKKSVSLLFGARQTKEVLILHKSGGLLFVESGVWWGVNIHPSLEPG